MPLVVAKAILIAFDKKIKEALSELIVCSDATTGAVYDKIRKMEKEMGIALEEEKDNQLPKEGTCENMVYIFCLSVFNSSDCNLKAVNTLRR